MIGLEYILQLTGMQQKDLAEKLGINKQNITLWIKGKQDISKKYLPILSDIFGLQQSFFQMELREIDKLAIQNELLFQKVQGSFVIESMDDEDDEVDGHPVIKVMPKNFETDPRFSQMCHNQLEIGLLQNLESLKNNFTMFDKLKYENEVERNRILKIYCDVIEQLDLTLFNIMDGKDNEYSNMIDALNQYRKIFEKD